MGTQKNCLNETVLFEHLKHMGKKTFTILRSKFCLSKPMSVIFSIVAHTLSQWLIFYFHCSYRTRDEIQDVRERRDPIINFKNRLTENNLATAEELKVRLRVQAHG